MGVQLSPKATAEQIRQAVRRALGDTRYREAAQRLARAITEEAKRSQAVEQLEEVAASREMAQAAPRANLR